jgi:hypothetical protein
MQKSAVAMSPVEDVNDMVDDVIGKVKNVSDKVASAARRPSWMPFAIGEDDNSLDIAGTGAKTLLTFSFFFGAVALAVTRISAYHKLATKISKQLRLATLSLPPGAQSGGGAVGGDAAKPKSFLGNVGDWVKEKGGEFRNGLKDAGNVKKWEKDKLAHPARSGGFFNVSQRAQWERWRGTFGAEADVQGLTYFEAASALVFALVSIVGMLVTWNQALSG